MRFEVLRRNPEWAAIALIAALGLGLRIAAAQGALWLDEAWSAVEAHDVGTPLGVFLNINHDNNHHLNTLWLQLVGIDAPSLVQRGLSILTGTAAIPVAAAIAARHGAAAAICTALLFAVSPMLVTYGSEARGYAPMALALLVALLVLARWLDDPVRPTPAIGLAATVLLGMLSQLTFAFGLAALTGWTLWSLATRGALRRAPAVLAALLLPAAAVIALVFGAAYHAGGFKFGAYAPFDLWALADGVGTMAFAAVGGPVAVVVAALLILPSDHREERPGPARDQLFLLIALLIPLGVALLRLGNSGTPRYHLLAGVAALMLIAIRSGPRMASDHALRWFVTAGFALVILASLITDTRIIANRRADPGRAVEVIAARAPTGAEAAVARARTSAALLAAAAAHHYPLRVVETPCPATRFLFVDRDGQQPFPERQARCGAVYRPLVEAHPVGLSGTHWKLYERIS